MMAVDDTPNSPKSVRSWKTFGSRKGSKVYVEEDMPAGQDQPHSPRQIQLPPKLSLPNLESSDVTSPPSDQLNSDGLFRGVDRMQFSQPPKTPPKSYEPELMTDEKLNMHRIPFDKEYSVELLIEEAIGLPLTVSATRIHAKLHMPTRNDVRDVSDFAYGELLSDHTSPKFNFVTRYRGKMLHQTMTIIVRLDGLEIPSLTPKIIGYAPIRLCVNRIGMQPLSEILSDGRPSCYYNTGEFTIPILYGTFPNVPFVTETKFHECLPHIDGAFLKVKLATIKMNDPVPNGHPTPLPATTPTRMSLIRRTSSLRSIGSSRHSLLSSSGSSVSGSTKGPTGVLDKAINIRSIPEQVHLAGKTSVSMVLKTYLTLTLADNHNGHGQGHGHESPFQLLSLEDAILHQFAQGDYLDNMSRHTAILCVQMYITTLFETQIDPKECLHSQYLLPYKQECGCMAKLDVLYNMPDRKKLIHFVERAASVAAMRTGLSRKWDNKINFFKTVFRYLPGSLVDEEDFVDVHGQPLALGMSSGDSPTQTRPQNPKSSCDTPPIQELIIDDASVKPSLLSTETCPVYLDEFSCTADLRLGRKACLLVIVTAVDVLTTKKAGNENSTFTPTTPTLEPSPSNAHLLSSTGESFVDDGPSSPTAKAKEKLTKLKGLLGVYVGRDDPRATWWGLIPLFAKNPLCPPGSHVGSCTAAGVSSSSSGHGAHHGSFLFSHLGASSHSPTNQRHLSYLDPSVDQPSTSFLPPAMQLAPLRIPTSAAPARSALSFPLFVNEGTHQIPLFQGLPPEEMINSADPMAWVLRRLQQQAGRPVTTRSSLTSIAELFLSPLVMAGLLTPKAGGGHGHGNADSGQDSPATPSLRMSTVASSSRKSKKKKSKSKVLAEELVLSPGCSAFVRIVDPRMKRLGGYSLVEDSQKSYSQDYLSEVLTLQSQYAVDGGNGNGNGTGTHGNGNASGSMDTIGTHITGMHTTSGGVGNGTAGTGNGHGGTQQGILIPPTPTSTASHPSHHHHIAIDQHKLKTLKTEFAYQPSKLFSNKRVLKTAIPETIDPTYLFQEVTEKFYQALATGGGR